VRPANDTGQTPEAERMTPTFSIYPVGVIRKAPEKTWIEVFEPFTDALLGLEGFSHILVFFWFHENDTPAHRGTLRVHPRKNPQNPLTGVFATHSPARPNLIGLTRCRMRTVRDRIIEIEEIDARDGSPVIDIKCHIPSSTSETDVRVPAWV
jgi:tRNA-Thr(GGU) m(6)t(6)A37 methyltransferase TsaA